MRSLVDQPTVAQVPKIADTTDTAARLDPLHGTSISRGGIFHVYGWTSVLMVVAFLLSGVWTLVLAVVQLVPSDVANLLMGTQDLDFGDFWTLQRADDAIVMPATVCLVAIALAYFGLVVEMLLLSRRGSKGACQRPRRSAEIHPSSESVRSAVSLVPEPHSRASLQQAWESSILTTTDLPQKLDRRRRLSQWVRPRVTRLLESHDTPALALPKLLLQTTVLFKYLREGFPQTTIFFYASLLLVNWLISAYCGMAQLVDPRLALVRVFYSFDLFFAVYAPLQVIVYGYTTFTFDSAEFATRREVLNPGNFEVVARLFADPAEVSLFRAAFRSLQLSSLWSLLVKIALNAFTIRRWWRTIRLLGETNLAQARPASTQRLSRTHAVLFFFIGAAIFLYSTVSVVSSTVACARFEQCKVPSYRWNVGALECSCSVFVDRHTIVRSFAEWENPVDITADLARLAASGDLKVVQIVNRQLLTFPDELRRCTGLEQLILLYTKTVAIPGWGNEFTNLEYFHIEGDFSSKQLQSLPHDLFANSPKLTFLHLGCLLRVPFVPDLDRVPQLKYLTLAILHSVTELPSFDKLVHLERLTIVEAVQIPRLPSLSALTKLSSLVVAGSNAVCCNGFLSGICDASSVRCQDTTGVPRFQCSSERISASDHKLVDAVGYPVCKDNQLGNLAVSPVTPESSDGACGGVLYKRCRLGDRDGICVNTRWMAINCQPFGAYEAIRRLQIQRGVGDPCDPDVERWLGCGTH